MRHIKEEKTKADAANLRKFFIAISVEMTEVILFTTATRIKMQL